MGLVATIITGIAVIVLGLAVINVNDRVSALEETAALTAAEMSL